MGGAGILLYVRIRPQLQLRRFDKGLSCQAECEFCRSGRPSMRVWGQPDSDEGGYRCSNADRCPAPEGSLVDLARRMGIEGLVPRGPGRPMRRPQDLGRVAGAETLRSVLGLTDSSLKHFGLGWDYRTRSLTYPAKVGDLASTRRHARSLPGGGFSFATGRRLRQSGPRPNGEERLPLIYNQPSDESEATEFWLVPWEPVVWILDQAGIAAASLFAGTETISMQTSPDMTLARSLVHLLVPASNAQGECDAMVRAGEVLRAWGANTRVHEARDLRVAEDMAAWRRACGSNDALGQMLADLPELVAPPRQAFRRSPVTAALPTILCPGMTQLPPSAVSNRGSIGVTVERAVTTVLGFDEVRAVVVTGEPGQIIVPNQAGDGILRPVADGIAVRESFAGPWPHRWSTSAQDAYLAGEYGHVDGNELHCRVTAAFDGCGESAASALARFTQQSYVHVAFASKLVLDIRGDPKAIQAARGVLSSLVFNPVVVPADDAGDWPRAIARTRGVALLEPRILGGDSSLRKSLVRLTRADCSPAGRLASRLKGVDLIATPVAVLGDPPALPKLCGPLIRVDLVGLPEPRSAGYYGQLRDDLYAWALRVGHKRNWRARIQPHSSAPAPLLMVAA